MEIALDTNILIKGFKEGVPSCSAVLYHFYGNYRLKILWDYLNENQECIVRKEYEQNLRDNETYQKWITALSEGDQISYRSGKLSTRIKSKLVSRGFHEPTDHVFVALALVSDKCIITEDSDYGKGDNPKALEPEKMEVLRFLTEELYLKVLNSEEGIIFLRSC